MMEKLDAIDQFLKAFRISFNFISLYSQSHRSFRASAAQLKEKLDALLVFLDPVEIACTVDSLVIDGRPYTKPLHRELAAIFHNRKIKNISFQSGITEEELVKAIDILALPKREIMKRGGISVILAKNPLPHFSQEELDYSRLLTGEGTEASDVWSHLLDTALRDEGMATIEDFLETFEAITAKISAKTLVEDETLRTNIQRFLEYVRAKDEGKFKQCAQALLRAVIRGKEGIPLEQVPTLKALFTDLDVASLSRVLWESIAHDEAFDTMGLELFSHLVDQEKHDAIANTLIKAATKTGGRPIEEAQVKRMKNIFAVLPGQAFHVPDSYRKAIAAISKGQFVDRGFVFARQQIQTHYDQILLDLVVIEEDPQERDRILRKISDGWDQLVSRAAPQYFLSLWNILETIPKDLGDAAELNHKFLGFIEEGMWTDNFPAELCQHALLLEKSVLGADVYLRRIFKEGKCPPLGISLFFKLFPSRVNDFYAALSFRAGDFEFMSTLIGGIKRMSVDTAIMALKEVFARVNELVKTEVIRAMAELPRQDVTFLLSLLETRDYFLKKEALVVLMKNPDTLAQALRLLFEFKNPWGKKNALMVENIAVVEEAECRSARANLIMLTRLNFIFYAPVKKMARKILEKWDA